MLNALFLQRYSYHKMISIHALFLFISVSESNIKIFNETDWVQFEWIESQYINGMKIPLNEYFHEIFFRYTIYNR